MTIVFFIFFYVHLFLLNIKNKISKNSVFNQNFKIKKKIIKVINYRLLFTSSPLAKNTRTLEHPIKNPPPQPFFTMETERKIIYNVLYVKHFQLSCWI